MSNYTVTAYLRAVDQGFSSTFSKADRLMSGFGKQAGALNNTSGKLKSFTQNLKSTAGGFLIAQAAGKVFGKAIGSVHSAMGRIDTMERFERTITQITGNSEAAGRALDALKDITVGTAYGLDVAAKATQDFVTRGMSLEDATKSVGAWADAVAFYGEGTNAELASVTDALAKMRTSGKVHMDQMNRLFDVGIDAVGMYAQATGRAAADVQKDLSSGKISADEFLSVVEKAMMEGTNGVQKIAGAAKEAGASWKGTLDNMSAAFTRGVMDIIESIDLMLANNGLPTMREAIRKFGQTAESVMGKVATVIRALGDATQPLSVRLEAIKWYLEPIIPVLGLIGAAQATAFALPYIDAFASKVDLIPELLGKVPTAAGKAVDLLGKSIQTGEGKLWALARSATDVLGNVGRGLSNTFTLWGRLPLNLQKALSTGFGGTFNVITGVISKMHGLALTGMKLIGPAALLGLAVAGLGLVYSNFGDQIDQMVDLAVTKGPGIIQGLVDGITSKIPDLIAKGTELVARFAEVVEANLPALVQGGIQIIGSLLQGIMSNMPSLISSAVTIIGSFAMSIAQALPQLLMMGAQLMVSLIQGVITNLPQIISTAVSVITTFIEGMLSNLPQMVTMGFELIGSLVGAIITNLPEIIQAGWDIIKALALGILEAIPAVLTAAWDGVRNGFSNLWDMLTGKSSETSASLEADASAATTAIGDRSEEMSERVGLNTEEMERKLREDFDAINQNAPQSMASTSEQVINATNAMEAGATPPVESLESTTETSFAGIENSATSHSASAAKQTTSEFQSLEKNASSSINALKQNVDSSMKGAEQSMKASIASMNSAASTGFDTMVQGAAQFGNRVQTTITNMMRTVQQSVTSGMSQMTSRFTQGFRQAETAARTSSSTIRTIMSNLVSALYSSGYYAGIGLRNGLAAAAPAIYATANSIAQNVKNTINSALAVQSPSKETYKTGKWTGEGLVLGMEAMIRKIKATAEKIALSANPNVDDIRNRILSGVETSRSRVQTSVAQALGGVGMPQSNNLNLTLRLGNRSYRVFVDDITKAQGKEVVLDEVFAV